MGIGVGIGLGHGARRGIFISTSIVADAESGPIATLYSLGLDEAVTYSKESGDDNISVAPDGTVSLSEPMSHGDLASFVGKADDGTNSHSATFTLTCALAGLYNFDPDTQFTNTQAGAARIAGETGRLRVLMLGSSSVRGWASGTGGIGVIDARRHGYAYKLAGLMAGRGLPAQAEGFLGAGSGSGITAGQEPALTIGSGFVVNNGNYDSIGGRPFINATTSNALIHSYDEAFVFDSIVTFDQIDTPVVANTSQTSGSNIITVNSIVSGGPIEPGMPYLSGGGIPAGTVINAFGAGGTTGTGGPGTYQISANATNSTTTDRTFGMTTSWKYQFGSDPSSAAQSSQGAPAVRSQTFSSGNAPANQTLRVSRQNGALRFQGFIPFDSTVPGADIVIAGWPGSLVSNWIDNTKGYGARAGLIAVDADIYVIQCFASEYTAATSLDVAEANLRTLISVIKGLGKDILLLSAQPVDESFYGGRPIQPYVDRMKAVAEDEGLPVFSFFDMLGGAYDPANYFTNDPLHWVESTHALAATRLDRIFELAGA